MAVRETDVSPESPEDAQGNGVRSKRGKRYGRKSSANRRSQGASYTLEDLLDALRELEEGNFEVELPEGYRLLKAPESFDVDHACFAARRRTEIEGRRVKVGFEYTRRCPGISVDEYSEYRKAALNVQKQMRDEIVFGREPPPKKR